MACDGQLPPAPPAQIINLASAPYMTQTPAAPTPLPTGYNPQDVVVTPLIACLINNESGGLDSAIGDKGLTNHAYGPLQIRQPCLDDVNKWNGTRYTAAQMLNNRPLSVWVFNAYMRIYATQTRLGRPVTDQDRARIWNGGPNGYEIAATVKYWNSAVAFAKKQKPPLVLA